MNIVVLIAALMIAEGKPGNTTKGKDDELGCLQIRPIFVRECNRIIGSEKYFLTDREDRQKSIEMATVWLVHYRATFIGKYGYEPAYYDMATIYNRGWSGYQKPHFVPQQDAYWLKVKAGLNELGDW